METQKWPVGRQTHSLTHDLKQVVVKGCCCEPCVTLGLMTSRREAFDLRSDEASLLEPLCSKVLLKYNR